MTWYSGKTGATLVCHQLAINEVIRKLDDNSTIIESQSALNTSQTAFTTPQ